MKKKTTTDAKASANRRNARKSTGPMDTSSTRLNATKHGLLSEGITELDDAEGYRDSHRRLQGSYFDEMEAFLVERIALYIVRLRRTPRLEAELITSILHPPRYSEGLPMLSLDHILIDPGQPARIDSEAIEALVRYHRYESTNENKLYRAMNQLERIRRIHQGEHVPAPASVDLIVHSESLGIESGGPIPFESSQTSLATAREDANSDGTNEQPSRPERVEKPD